MPSRRTSTSIALCLALGAAAAAGAPEPTHTLDGDWMAVSATVGPQQIPAAQLANLNIHIAGNRMTPQREPTDVATLSVDDTKQPAWFDTTDARGQTNLGIYKLEGDQFTLCAGWPGDPRPTTFDPPADSRLIKVVMQRAMPTTAPASQPATQPR